MKLNLKTKKNKKAPKAEITKPSKAPTKASGHVITAANFHGGDFYVGVKIPTATIRKAALGLAIPKMPHAGFLVIHGDKPGILFRAVHHDGSNFYSHKGDDGVEKFGCIEAINSLERKEFYAEFTDIAGLKALAKKIGKAVEVTRVSDKAVFKVALLNSMGDQYVGALAKTAKGVEPMVLEHRAAWNKPKVQYDFGKELKASAVLA